MISVPCVVVVFRPQTLAPLQSRDGARRLFAGQAAFSCTEGGGFAAELSRWIVYREYDCCWSDLPSLAPSALWPVLHAFPRHVCVASCQALAFPLVPCNFSLLFLDDVPLLLHPDNASLSLDL